MHYPRCTNLEKSVLPFSKYTNAIFAQRKPNSKLRPLVDLRKIKILSADDYTKNNNTVSKMQHNIWQENPYSASSIALRLIITVCRWWTNGQWKCLHLIMLAQPLPTKDSHKVLANLCLLFLMILSTNCYQAVIEGFNDWSSFWNFSELFSPPDTPLKIETVLNFDFFHTKGKHLFVADMFRCFFLLKKNCNQVN